MGLKVDYMGGPYEIKLKDGSAPIYIHEFVGQTGGFALRRFYCHQTGFEEALEKVWSGEIENDAFNALTLRVGLGWNAIVVLRAFARYLRQLRIPYSHEGMAAALVAHPEVAAQIYALFHARHDPRLKTGRRKRKCARWKKIFWKRSPKIDVLEEDRIIRALYQSGAGFVAHQLFPDR